MSSYFSQSWVWIFIAIALVLFVSEIFLRRKLHVFTLFRLIWILALGAILADWTSVRPKEFSQPQTLRIFVDQSDSILKIEERKKRMLESIEEIKSWAKKNNQPTEILSFGDDIAPFDAAREKGSLQTRISPLEAFLSKRKVEGGVNVLLSDGLWSDEMNPSSPVVAVQMGEPDEEKDIWIDELQSVSTAFLKNRLRIPVTLGQHGYRGQEVRVELKTAEGNLVDQKTLALTDEFNPVELTYFPDRMGEQFLSLKIYPLEGELSEVNNQSPIRVRVVRDKIRVLHICGKPSADLKAWRSFLTRQPDVDLVSFYILRSLEDEPQARNSELSLIPFPYEELFSTELERFDVVILQNFDFNLYFQPFYLANLANFVENGGALLMIGGDQGFHRYESSPLEPILPFEYSAGQSSILMPGQYKIRFKEKSLVTRGLETAFQTPDWTARHFLKQRKKATTPVEYSDGSPLLSFWDFDKGRVFSINSDESWKLQIQPGVKPRETFAQLSRRILQYLTFDPEMDAHPIFSGNWKTGERIRLEWNIPETSRAQWKIAPDQNFGLPRSQSRAEENFSGSPVEYLVDEPGVYRVQVEDSQKVFKSVDRRFMTEEEPWRGEWKRLVSSDLKMKNLAQGSQGKFFSYADRHKIFNEELTGRQILSADIQSMLRSSPQTAWIAFILFILMIGLDFFFRKRSFWDG